MYLCIRYAIWPSKVSLDDFKVSVQVSVFCPPLLLYLYLGATYSLSCVAISVTAFHCGRAETVAAFPTIPSIPELPPDLPVESADFTPLEKKPEPKDVWKPAPIKQAIDRILIGEVALTYRILLCESIGLDFVNFMYLCQCG